MFASTGARRLVLIRRTVAAAAAGPNPLQLQPQPQPHATRLAHRYYSSAPLVRTPDPGTAASCGLSPAAASRRVRISSPAKAAKADAVLSVLRLHGFSDAHIPRLLRINPGVLLMDPDKILRPKLAFFASIGVGADVVARSRLLERSLEKHLVPCIDFLRDILGTDANIRAAVSGYLGILEFNLDNRMRPAVEALRCHGLSEEAISKLLVIQVGVLRMPPNRIAGIFEDLEVLGLPVTDPRFVRCFRAMCSLKRETVWRRLALYQSFGLSEDQVAKAFRVQPHILLLTDERIQGKLLFFLDELKISLPQVIARPISLTLSVEKNILPRCAVLSVLTREGMIQGDIDLLSLLLLSAKRFSERYVKKYENDVPDVVRAYEGKIKFKGFMEEDNEVSAKPRHKSSSVG